MIIAAVIYKSTIAVTGVKDVNTGIKTHVVNEIIQPHYLFNLQVEATLRINSNKSKIYYKHFISMSGGVNLAI